MVQLDLQTKRLFKIGIQVDYLDIILEHFGDMFKYIGEVENHVAILTFWTTKEQEVCILDFFESYEGLELTVLTGGYRHDRY